MRFTVQQEIYTRSFVLQILGQSYLRTALRVQHFEHAGAATKIDLFGSDRKRPRWELNSFLLPKRPKIGRLLAIRFIVKVLSTAHAPIWSQRPRAQNTGYGEQP